MKRIAMCVAILLLLANMQGLLVYAQTIVHPDESVSIGVKATYSGTEDTGLYQSKVVGNTAFVVTEDGVIIRITDDYGQLQDGDIFVVKTIEEQEEAFAWISGLLSQYDNLFPFYMYIWRDGEMIVLTKPVEVTVTLSANSKYFLVHHVLSDETVQECTVIWNGKSFTFSSMLDGFYVLSESSKPPEPSGSGESSIPPESSKPESGTSSVPPSGTPKTGENTITVLLIVLIGYAVGSLLIIMRKRKRE